MCKNIVAKGLFTPRMITITIVTLSAKALQSRLPVFLLFINCKKKYSEVIPAILFLCAIIVIVVVWTFSTIFKTVFVFIIIDILLGVNWKFCHYHLLIVMFFQTCMTSICGTKKYIFLKGSYDAILKIIILCIWCNRICWHALIFKKHIIFSNTVHYCISSMPRLSQMRRFLQSPSFRQAQSALIGLSWPVHCDWPNTTSTGRKCNFSYNNRERFQNKCKDS